ncbi:E3 ubiquitin-protein ligase DZIP3-like [Stylophora pistillata]|uniref:E3 ubiquitin-protein ligase DZIP3-like n=1 Tax=Stylophora pistillata TaxID=50429 RepID=UPI000C039B0C|nr:E3 ubiquitin-protein ligase DZIP3-like [Stylophora pistillata]
MASGAPTFKSTKETTNYARLCRLMVDVGTQALRDTFDAFHPSANLLAVFVGNKATLQVLKKRNVINATQWGELFPTISSSVSSANFDITLLMVLLRNLCGLPSPATGWDKLPAVTDVSREADIARIKYYRNTVYGHAGRASVDDATFNANWGDIRDTLVRLGGVKYRADIDKLETEVMDPDLDDHYRGLLQQWKKDEDNVKDQLNEVKKKLDDLKSTVKDLKADELLNTVRHTPMSVGLRDMSAEINGEPLTGSLRKVQVTGHPKALHSFRSPGKGQGEFDVPCSIAVSERTGNIAIAGFSNR